MTFPFNGYSPHSMQNGSPTASHASNSMYFNGYSPHSMFVGDIPSTSNINSTKSDSHSMQNGNQIDHILPTKIQSGSHASINPYSGSRILHDSLGQDKMVANDATQLNQFYPHANSFSLKEGIDSTPLHNDRLSTSPQGTGLVDLTSTSPQGTGSFDLGKKTAGLPFNSS